MPSSSTLQSVLDTLGVLSTLKSYKRNREKNTPAGTLSVPSVCSNVDEKYSPPNSASFGVYLRHDQTYKNRL